MAPQFWSEPDSKGKNHEEVRAQLDSRSTSSGSTTPLSSEADLPEAPVSVKNTFIEVAIGRPPSLDGFFEERHTKSCPSSRPRSPDRGPEFSPSARDPPEGLLARAGAAAAELVAPERCEGSVAEPSPSAAPAPQKQVLLLGNVLKQPELGSPELPSVGSANHRLGGCKPCAFAHTKGCENGVNCQFCHLCQPGEKKRRQRQRTARQPDARQEPRPDARGPAVSPVMCQPMMSRLVMVDNPSTPAASPTVNNWQAANLCMAAVFRVF